MRSSLAVRVSRALALALFFVPATARAEPRVRVDAAGDCVDRASVQSVVEEAIGPAADLDVHVRVTCEPRIVVELDLSRAHASTSRRLDLAPEERADLPAAIALGVGIAADALDRTVEPSQIASTIPHAVLPTPVVMVEPPAPDTSLAIELSAQGGAIVGLAPTIAPVVGAGIALRFDRALSVALDAMGTVPIDTRFGEGRVRVASLSGRLSGCADGSLGIVELGGCVGAWVGGMYGETSSLRVASGDGWGPWTALEGRARATILLGAFFVRVEVAALGVLVSPSFVVGAGDAQVIAAHAEPLAGAATLSMGVRFVP